jgi:hypothetical protein
MEETNTNNQIEQNVQATGPGPELKPSLMDRLRLSYIENKWAFWLIGITLLITGVFIALNFWAPRGEDAKPKVGLEVEAPVEIASGSEIVYKIKFSNKESSLIKDITVDMIYPSGFTYDDSVPKTTSLSGNRFDLPNLEPGQEGTIMIKGSIVGNVDEVKTVNALMKYKFENFSSDFAVQAQSQSKIVNSSVIMQFDGPFRAAAGQNLTYTLNYVNNTEDVLNELKLNIETPANFKVISQEPKATEGSNWNISSFAPDEKRQIQLVGVFENTKAGEEQIFSAEVEGRDQTGQVYTLSTATYTVTMVQQPLTVEMTVRNQTNSGSTVANPGDILDYRIKYTNHDSAAAHGVIVSAQLLSEALDVQTIDAPNANIQGDTINWDASQVRELGDLAANKSGEVGFRVRVKNPVTRSDTKNLVVTTRATIKSYEFEQPFVSSDIVIKIATVVKVETGVQYNSGSRPPLPGKSTTYKVTIEARNASNDIEGAVMSFNLPNSLDFDRTTINSAESNNVSYDRNSRKVTWNMGRIPAHMGYVSPSRKIEFNVSITPAPANSRKSMTLVNNIRLNGTDSFIDQPLVIDVQDITTLQDQAGQGVVGGF